MNSKPMKISLKDDAVPFALPVPRQIPLAFRRMVKTELDQLVQAGVIAPVTEATDWVHPIWLLYQNSMVEFFSVLICRN